MKKSSQKSVTECCAHTTRTSKSFLQRSTTAWPQTEEFFSSWRRSVAMSSQKRNGGRSRARLCSGRPTNAPSASRHSQGAVMVNEPPQGRASASLPGRQSSCPAHTRFTSCVCWPWRSSPRGTALLSTRVLSATLATKRKFLKIIWGRVVYPKFG